MRQTTVIALFIAALMGVALYYLKYRVTELESELTRLNQNIVDDQQAVHVLRAEWSYLNETSRLRTIAEQHLGMVPVTPDQFITPEELPARKAVADKSSKPARESVH
jgi:cell division protein FtsL